jgi:hypothetical protein
MTGANAYGGGSVYGGAPSGYGGASQGYSGSTPTNTKIYGGGTMPSDLGNIRKEEQASYIGSAVSAVGGAVVGAGSILTSGASYLGLWKGSPSKTSLADQ